MEVTIDEGAAQLNAEEFGSGLAFEQASSPGTWHAGRHRDDGVMTMGSGLAFEHAVTSGVRCASRGRVLECKT